VSAEYIRKVKEGKDARAVIDLSYIGPEVNLELSLIRTQGRKPHNFWNLKFQFL
jgi:hypothetical protein